MKKVILSVLVVAIGITSYASALPTCPNPPLQRNLYLGSSGSDVSQLQSFLNGRTTGYFGLLTFNLVRSFQRAHGITPVGAVGPVTRQAIANSCEPGTTNPNPGGGTVCTAQYQPVCGTLNGVTKTYGNKCTLDASGASFIYNGECNTSTDPNTAPNNCKVWYDGCNTCSRSYEGGPLACTLMYCFAQSQPYCKEYFSTNPNPGGGTVCTADAMQCPNGQWVGRTGPNCQFVCPN